MEANYPCLHHLSYQLVELYHSKILKTEVSKSRPCVANGAWNVIRGSCSAKLQDVSDVSRKLRQRSLSAALVALQRNFQHNFTLHTSLLRTTFILETLLCNFIHFAVSFLLIFRLVIRSFSNYRTHSHISYLSS